MKLFAFARSGRALLAARQRAHRRSSSRATRPCKVMPDGTKKVETPPLPAATARASACAADKPACTGGGWRMVETADGLRECTEIYARARDLPRHRPTAQRSARGCGS